MTKTPKTEITDRIKQLSRRCEEYACAFEDAKAKVHAGHPDSDWEHVIAIGARLTEVRQDLSDYLAVTLR